MSTATERTEPAQSVTGSWQAGVLGGVVGALAMGGLMLATNEPTLAVAIPSLYALAPPPNVAAGLFVHLSQGVMPLWLSAVGSPASPPFPNFAVPSLLWHVVYGVFLGGVYAATVERL
ncbi:histidine kinase [Halobacteriales archaeon QH_1_68_42]|nr:MAG: histidine kinase [Halobacteriales archaeon QH_1_68_42]